MKWSKTLLLINRTEFRWPSNRELNKWPDNFKNLKLKSMPSLYLLEEYHNLFF